VVHCARECPCVPQYEQLRLFFAFAIRAFFAS
jgi:hypothetical protein